MTCYFKRAKTIDVFFDTLAKKTARLWYTINFGRSEIHDEEMCKENELIQLLQTMHTYVCKATKMFQARVSKD